jgi:hypothetical protein
MYKLSGLCAALVAIVVALPATASSKSSGAKLCVGGHGCYATLQAALDASHDGDTIMIGRGTFAGGVTVRTSVALVGAGASQTSISGGGPVVTVGTYQASSEPSVSISGVTITGGVTTSSPESDDFVGVPNVIALGGGISVPPSAGFSTGATLTVSNSVITGNRVAPSATLPIGPPCPGGPCPFAWAKGAGIDSWGNVTLLNTTVSTNTAAGVASDADGGGIDTWQPGTLVLDESTLAGNTAAATVPNGRFAEGGGIFMDSGSTLTVRNSNVVGNGTLLTSTFPYFVGGGQTLDMNSNSGGIHTGDNVTTTIDNTHIDRNSIVVNDPNGEPLGFDAGLCVCTDDQVSGNLVLRNSTVSGNTVDVTVGSSADVGSSGAALDLDSPGSISNVQVVGNTVVVRSATGDAGAVGALSVADADQSARATISDTLIRGNTTRALAPNGAATVQGAGLTNQGPLLLQNVGIIDNAGIAQGHTAVGQGGGIYNGTMWSPPGPLTLDNTLVAGNSLTGSAGGTFQGGGIYAFGFAPTLHNSLVTRNTPDQCFGC